MTRFNRNPGLWFAGNLMWTRSGTVVATWRLRGIPYGFRPDKDKETARVLHQALFRALTGESQLSGVRTMLDPFTIVERMVAGVDLDNAPQWAAECEATLDSLSDVPLGQRQYWLSVPLIDRKLVSRLRAAARAGLTAFSDQLALPRTLPDETEVRLYLEQARQLELLIPSMFHAEPATPAQMVWLNQHVQQRGLPLDYEVPPVTHDAPKTGIAIPEPLVDEGAKSDYNRASWRDLQLTQRRLVKISQPNTPEEVPASYQALLTVGDGPHAGWAFPGSELLGRVDESAIDVDWTIRLQQRSSHEAATANRRALNRLKDQLDQRENEVSANMTELDRVASLLTEYLGVLEADRSEVEIHATFIFAVAGPTREDALDQAKMLTQFFDAFEFRLEQPIGHQSTLWWATVPGTPLVRNTRAYAQIITSRDLSTLVPITSTGLGGSKGIRIGQNISAPGLPDIVLVDPEGYTIRNQSGSIALSGDLGSGKSVLLKLLTGAIGDRGGRFITFDSSATGEWLTFGRSVVNTVGVDIEAPEYSLDPLQLFGPGSAARVTQSFLTPLLGLPARSAEGSLLSEVLEPRYLAEHNIARLGALLHHLEHGCRLPDADRLAQRMRVFASKDFGRVVFDDSLEPMPLDADGIVVRTHTLQQPTREELLTEHLYHELSLEKIFGRAIYALGANMVRWISAADTSRLTAFPVDEFHEVGSSPEALRAVRDIVLKGRKEKTVLLAATQDPGAAYSDSSIRGLIPTRIAMRHESPEIAAEALKWLGQNPEDAELIEILTRDTSPMDPDTEEVHPGREGEGFMRDANGNIGRIKVDLPALPGRSDACLTTPEEYRAQREMAGAR